MRWQNWVGWRKSGKEGFPAAETMEGGACFLKPRLKYIPLHRTASVQVSHVGVHL